MLGECVHCGGAPDTCDHVPSRVLLDEPYPQNLPVADSCSACNNGFSSDEQYLACLIDCVITGSTDPTRCTRPKVARFLAENPALAARIAHSETVGPNGEQVWRPEIDRVNKVLLKLARGHVAFELSLLQIDEPVSVSHAPVVSVDRESRDQFIQPQQTPFWPEIGSRAFNHVCKSFPPGGCDEWQIVQPGRYQYLVSQADGLFVRMLISDYLLCEVRWD